MFEDSEWRSEENWGSFFHFVFTYSFQMSVLLRPAGGIKNMSKVLVHDQKARTKDIFPLMFQDVLKVTVFYVK